MIEENEFLQIPQEIHSQTPSSSQKVSVNNQPKFTKVINQIHLKQLQNTQNNVRSFSQKKLKVHVSAQKHKVDRVQKAKTQNTFIDNEQYIRRYNKLNSIVVENPVVNVSHGENDGDKKIKKNSKMKMFRLEHVQSDKSKFPLKYKILCEQLGYEEDQVYKLKPQEILQIQEQFIKKKGNQYLREKQFEIKISRLKQSHKQSKEQLKLSKKQESRITRSITQNSAIVKDTKKEYTKNYVHEIFADVSEKLKQRQQKRKREERSNKRKEMRLNEMNDRQQILGQIIYERLARHKVKSRNSNILKLYKDEQKIDSTLIAIIRTKIKKAQLSLEKK